MTAKHAKKNGRWPKSGACRSVHVIITQLLNGGVLTVLVAFGKRVQVIHVVVVIAGCAQDFKRQVTYNRRRSGHPPQIQT